MLHRSATIASRTFPGVEVIEAFVDGVISRTVDHYWIEDTPYGADDRVDNLKVLHYDEEDNMLVIGCPGSNISDWCSRRSQDEDGLYLVTFDGDDQFNVVETGAAFEDADGETYADFKAELQERDTITVTFPRGPGGVHNFTRTVPVQDN